MVFPSLALRVARAPKNGLSFEEFIFRREVLKTYRHITRVIYKHHEKTDLATFAKQEFRQDCAGMLISQRKYLLKDGIKRINLMAIPLKW